MQLSGITADNFDENQEAIESSIAESTGVDSDQVTVELAENTRRVRRRLQNANDGSDLGGDAALVVTIDASADEVQAVVNAVNDETQFGSDLTGALTLEGITTNVSGLTAPTVQVTDPSPSTSPTKAPTDNNDGGDANTSVNNDDSGDNMTIVFIAIAVGVLIVILGGCICFKIGGGEEGEKGEKVKQIEMGGANNGGANMIDVSEGTPGAMEGTPGAMGNEYE